MSNYAQFVSPLLDYVLFNSIGRMKANELAGSFLDGVHNATCQPPVSDVNDGINFFAMLIAFSVWGAIAVVAIIVGWILHSRQSDCLAGSPQLSLFS